MADNSIASKIGIPVVLPTIDPSPVAYTCTVSGLGSGSGTTIATKQQYGSLVHIVIQFTKDATAGTGTADVAFTMPSGLTQLAGSPQPNGTGEYRNASNQYIPLSSVAIGNLIYSRIGGTANLRGADLIATTGTVYIDIWIPVTEYVTTSVTAYGAGQATSVSPGLVSSADTGSFTATFSSVFAAGTTVKYDRTNTTVTLTFPQFNVNASGSGNTTIATAALPARAIPASSEIFFSVPIIDSNTTLGLGIMRVTSGGNIQIYRNATGGGANWTTAVTGGWQAFSITYSVV